MSTCAVELSLYKHCGLNDIAFYATPLICAIDAAVVEPSWLR